ncbi:hypothetical protein INR49_019234 [Caranx melampygus]|nr:hypothetical protein INR49_019234 [Caranx melampygus]
MSNMFLQYGRLIFIIFSILILIIVTVVCSLSSTFTHSAKAGYHTSHKQKKVEALVPVTRRTPASCTSRPSEKPTASSSVDAARMQQDEVPEGSAASGVVHAYHPKEDAKDCGGASAISLSISLFSASLYRLIGPPGDVDQDQLSNQDAQKEDMQYGSTELDAKGFILNNFELRIFLSAAQTNFSRRVSATDKGLKLKNCCRRVEEAPRSCRTNRKSSS